MGYLRIFDTRMINIWLYLSHKTVNNIILLKKKIQRIMVNAYVGHFI